MKTPTKQLLSAVIFASGLVASPLLLADDAQTAEHVGEMVNLTIDNQSITGVENCPLSGAFWYHLKVNADATLSEFSIPAGFTLVITGVDTGSVIIESSTSWQSIYTAFATSNGIQDVVVKPGVKICGSGSNIHGHFEKNR